MGLLSLPDTLCEHFVVHERVVSFDQTAFLVLKTIKMEYLCSDVFDIDGRQNISSFVSCEVNILTNLTIPDNLPDFFVNFMPEKSKNFPYNLVVDLF